MLDEIPDALSPPKAVEHRRINALVWAACAAHDLSPLRHYITISRVIINALAWYFRKIIVQLISVKMAPDKSNTNMAEIKS